MLPSKAINGGAVAKRLHAAAQERFRASGHALLAGTGTDVSSSNHGGRGKRRRRVCAVQLGPESMWYLGARKHARLQAMRSLDIDWDVRELPAGCTNNEALSAIAAINADDSVGGIVVVRPVPDHLSIKLLQEAVHPLKDVEGMHPNSIGKVVYGQKARALWPCTAKATVLVLQQGRLDMGLGASLEGVEVVVVGSSDVLVKPTVSLLHSEGATVTVCPALASTSSFAAHTRSADVVISSANQGPGIIRGDMLKPGCVLLDVGMNVQDDVFVGGDVDLDSCLGVAARYASLVHGIGVVRSAVFCQNFVQAVHMQELHKQQHLHLDVQ